MILILLLIGCFIIFPLYCCLTVSTRYEREPDDEQQLEFIENWKDSAQS